MDIVLETMCISDGGKEIAIREVLVPELLRIINDDKIDYDTRYRYICRHRIRRIASLHVPLVGILPSNTIF